MVGCGHNSSLLPTGDPGLGGGQEPGPDPDRLAAHHQRRGQASPITDAARPHNRDIDRIEHLGQQGHGSDVTGMAATLGALSDNHVGAVADHRCGLLGVADDRHHGGAGLVESVGDKSRRTERTNEDRNTLFEYHLNLSFGVGTEGVLRVLDSLEMIETIDVDAPPPTAWSESSRWLRASRSGMLHLDATLGDLVTAGDLVATIYDPFGKRLGRVTARGRGVVIGATQEPVVQRGDAVVHIAAVDEPPDVELLSPPE